jgi:HK97 family phage portal protein
MLQSLTAPAGAAKQVGPPGQNAGWRRTGISARMPRVINSFMDTYGGSDDGVLWVYACAGFIASELSSYPWDVLDPTDEVLAPEDVPAELADLLDRPNSLMTYSQMMEYVGLDLELGGNSYWLKDRRNALGQPFELMRLLPHLMRRAVDKQGRPIGHVYELEGRQIPFDLDEVVWLRYANPRDQLYGMGTVEGIQRDLGADLAITDHVVGFYSQGGRVSGVVTIDGAMGEDAFLRLQQQFEQEAMVQGNNFQLLIVEQGVRFDPITTQPAGTGIVELQRMTKDRVLSAFGVPEPLLGGVLENANYKITDSRYVFAQRMGPKATKVSQQFTVDLVDRWDGLQLQVDVTVSEPPHERAERTKQMRGSGASLNQLLDAQGLPVIDDPLADEPLLAKDMVPASLLFNPPAPPAAARPNARPQLPGQQPPEPLDDTGTEEPEEGDTLPDEAPAGAGRSQLGAGYTTLLKAQRPRTRKRTTRANSRFDKGASEQAQRVRNQLALPAAPQEGGGAPLVVPPLPAGYEEWGGDVYVKQGSSVAALRMLHHRSDLLQVVYPVWVAQMTTFFIGQRNRVLQALQSYSGDKHALANGKRDKKDLTVRDLWEDGSEDDILRAVYMPMVDAVGTSVLDMTGQVVGGQLRWDLAHPEVEAVRDRMSDKITRVNDTTKAAVREQVEMGLARGYSVVQIANGFPAEGYQGIMGAFDGATGYRAEMIARTETAMVYNETTVLGYRDAGVQEVEVLDGTGDGECAAAAGSVWDLDRAELEPIGHPNCVRAFVPIVR